MCAAAAMFVWEAKMNGILPSRGSDMNHLMLVMLYVGSCYIILNTKNSDPKQRKLRLLGLSDLNNQVSKEYQFFLLYT